ncbi:hypothetical protein FJZ36_08160 [Candidatus Poribacteria bacterium]|nr:hypothetical protein [Candidatus Poribacteria bacterium]
MDRPSPRILVAPTQALPPRRHAASDGPPVMRRARLRVDTVDPDYPGTGSAPSFAFVQLLEKPRVGQPVVWASRGTNCLTLYTLAMRTGGIAFVVTGLDYT